VTSLANDPIKLSYFSFSSFNIIWQRSNSQTLKVSKRFLLSAPSTVLLVYALNSYLSPQREVNITMKMITIINLGKFVCCYFDKYCLGLFRKMSLAWERNANNLEQLFMLYEVIAYIDKLRSCLSSPSYFLRSKIQFACESGTCVGWSKGVKLFMLVFLSLNFMWVSQIVLGKCFAPFSCVQGVKTQGKV
jgi:hypothetical protein